MLTRIITAIVSLIVFIAVIIAGEIPFAIAMGAVALFMVYEVLSATTKSKAIKITCFANSLVILAGMYLDILEIALVLSIIITMITVIWRHGKNPYNEVLSSHFLTLYIVLFLTYIPIMRIEYGLAVMGLVFIMAWGSDTSAYFCGTFFGKHKLIPKVSPKKTVEGFVGAFVMTGILCVAYVIILDKCGYPIMGESATWQVCIKYGIFGAAMSVLSQLGDLTASAVKRDAQIKDYGKVFPGHGGFMDRFDSVLLIAPVVYYVCMFIIF